MIRLRLDPRDSDQPSLFVLGVTDMNVAKLRNGQPIYVDLRELGGDCAVCVFHGGTARELEQQLNAIVREEQAGPALRAAIDQLAAMEADQRREQ